MWTGVCALSVGDVLLSTAYPVNMPDPIWKHFGYGQLRPVMALTASLQVHWARWYMPDPISCIRFGPEHIVQNQPGSDLDGLVRFS